MQDGDISNDTPPRWFVVMEGLVGNVDDKHRRRERFLVTTHQWSTAARLWDFDKQMVAHLWDAVWRWQQPVDLVTYLPEPYARAIEERLEDLNIPTGNFRIYDSPNQLANLLAFMPNVIRVVYAWPKNRPFMFGSRGLMLSGPEGIMAWTSSRA